MFYIMAAWRALLFSRLADSSVLFQDALEKTEVAIQVDPAERRCYFKIL